MNKTKNYILCISLLISFPLIGLGVGYGFANFFFNCGDSEIEVCSSINLILLVILPILTGLYGIMTYLPVLKDIRNGKQNVWDYHD